MSEVNREEPEDLQQQLFGNLIFSYTDGQALEDGVLFDVTPYTLHRVNRVTNAVYGWLGGFERPDDLAKEYRDLEDAAKAAYDKGKDKELVEFDYRGSRFWMMDNETGARTIMFPEDY